MLLVMLLVIKVRYTTSGGRSMHYIVFVITSPVPPSHFVQKQPAHFTDDDTFMLAYDEAMSRIRNR